MRYLYITIPREYMSPSILSLPSDLSRPRTSGAIVLSVPVGVTDVCVFRLAMPKSPIRKPVSFRKSPSKKMFSGLMSRCRIFLSTND